MAGVVTKASLGSEVLHPAMDAIALNERQRDLLQAKDSPQLDSLLACVEEAQRVVMYGGQVVARMVALCNELLALEHVELAFEQQITGYADETIREMHRAGMGGDQEAAKAMGARLVTILDRVAQADPQATNADLFDAVEARVDLHEIFRKATADVLFRPAVKYVIGRQRTAQLADLHKRWRETRHGIRPDTREASTR